MTRQPNGGDDFGDDVGGAAPAPSLEMRRQWLRRVALAGTAAAAAALGLHEYHPGAITLAIQDVSLIDGTGRPPRLHMTVLLSGQRIESVVSGRASLPESVPVIDGSGLTLLPGLIDTHIHWAEWMAPLFLRFGVTAVRDVGNPIATALQARRHAHEAPLRMPRFVAYGPLIDGSPPVVAYASVTPTSIDNARTVAEHLLENGFDGLKVYARLPADQVRAVVEVATAHGLPVAAHLNVTSAREAVAAGVRSIEHVYGVLVRETPESLADLPSYIVDHGVVLSATLLAQENLSNFRSTDSSDYPHLDLVPSTVARAWLAGTIAPPLYGNVASLTDAQVAVLRQGVANREAFLQRFYAAGGKITTGSDTGAGTFVIPGFSIHQELQRLVAVGLRPLDALQAATGTAAELLRRPDLGVIAPGKLADLLLVAGNPADDITATQNIRLVLKGGKVVYQDDAPIDVTRTPANGRQEA